MIHPKIPEIMMPVTEQPIVLRDNLLTPDYNHRTRRGSQGRIARAEANHGIEESLKGVTHLFIKQSIISAEFFVNALNKYEIMNSSGERVFLAAETTDFFTRLCYGGFQPFNITVYNGRPTSVVTTLGVGLGVGVNKDKDTTASKKKSFMEVLKFSGVPGFCTSVGHIQVTDGTKPLGNIQQIQKYGFPLYSVRTPDDKELLQIRGPDIGRCCFSWRPLVGSLEFEIIDPKDETMVGRIAKQWGGFARELFTKADIWGIKFPPDMESSTKALLLSSVFLIDFQYFER